MANEICAMWKQNTPQVIPIAITSTAVIPKSLAQSLKRLNFASEHIYTYTHIHKCKNL